MTALGSVAHVALPQINTADAPVYLLPLAWVWNTKAGSIALLVLAVLALLALLPIPVVTPVARTLLTLAWRYVAVPAVRFLAGRVVVRQQTRWDARYTTPAREIPDNVALMPGEVYPRTTWAKLPGWQRQAVRLGLFVFGYALTWSPVLVITMGVLVLLAVAVVRLSRTHWSRYHHEQVALIAAPLADSLQWDEVDPIHWIDLPARHWVMVPVDLPRFVWAALAWMSGDAREITSRFPRTRRLRRAISDRNGTLNNVLVSTSTRLSAWASWIAAHAQVPHREIPALNESESRVIIRYPVTCKADPKLIEDVMRIATTRLAGGPWKGVHHPSKLEIEMRHPTNIPKSVEYDLGTFERYDVTEIPIGQDKPDHDVVIPLKGKTPHVSMAASTGWGKTVTANVCAGHMLYHGSHGMILDPKRVGFVGAFRGLPNVELRTSLRGQIRGIRQVRDEMNRRYELIENYLDRTAELGLPSMKDFPEMYFQPLFMLEDEKGSLTMAIKGWWKREATESWEEDFKPEGKPGKGTPIPLDEQQEILWRGRAAAVHVFTFAQQNNLLVFLNSDMRDQYMGRILSGPQNQSSWIMTFPGTRKKAIPPKKGRAIWGIGAENLVELQLGYIPEETARAAAQHGVEIAEELNQERAERLAAVTGRPVWEVSPLPFWVPRPVRTVESVPGRALEAGHTAEDQEAAGRPVLSVLAGGGEETAGEVRDTPLTVIENGRDTDSNTSSKNVPVVAADESSAEPERPGMIVGLAAAAAHLEMNAEAFRKARQRTAIEGEETRGDGRPQWSIVDLEEWASKRPRAGANRVASDQ